ncbi:hypothetical protein [Streptomyces sp. NPDC058295]
MRTANADGAVPPSPRGLRTTPMTCRHHGAPQDAYTGAHAYGPAGTGE